MEYQKIINLIDNKIADVVAKLPDSRIMKASKNSQRNHSKTVANENNKEIHEERPMSIAERQNIMIILILI